MRQAFLACHTSELGGGGGKWPKSLCVSRVASQGQTGSAACVLLGDLPRLGAGQDHHFLVCEMEVIILQGHTVWSMPPKHENSACHVVMA